MGSYVKIMKSYASEMEGAKMDQEFYEKMSLVQQLSSFDPEEIYAFIHEKLAEPIISESCDERF